MIVDHKLTETAQKLVKDSFVVAIIVDDADDGIKDFKAIQEFTQKENVPLIVCGESIFIRGGNPSSFWIGCGFGFLQKSV